MLRKSFVYKNTSKGHNSVNIKVNDKPPCTAYLLIARYLPSQNHFVLLEIYSGQEFYMKKKLKRGIIMLILMLALECLCTAILSLPSINVFPFNCFRVMLRTKCNGRLGITNHFLDRLARLILRPEGRKCLDLDQDSDLRSLALVVDLPNGAFNAFRDLITTSLYLKLPYFSWAISLRKTPR
jgi:hypothetical protein